MSNVHLDYAGHDSETGSESVHTRIGVPLAGPVPMDQRYHRYSSADFADAVFPSLKPVSVHVSRTFLETGVFFDEIPVRSPVCGTVDYCTRMFLEMGVFSITFLKTLGGEILRPRSVRQSDIHSPTA